MFGMLGRGEQDLARPSPPTFHDSNPVRYHPVRSGPVQSSPPCQARLLPASELAVGEHLTHTIKSALGVDVLEEEEEEEEEEESIVRRCMYL